MIVRRTMILNVPSFHRYSLLALRSDGKDPRQLGDSMPNTKKVEADWNVGIGEEGVWLQVVPPPSKDMPSNIVVLGRKSFYVLQDTGVLIYSRKLEFHGTAMRSFRPRMYKSLNYIRLQSEIN